MGLFTRLKSWIKRSVVRVFLRLARTRVGRYVERVAGASAAPLAITGAGAFLGTGVASAAALPLVFGALVGGVIAVAGMAAKKLYERNAEQRSVEKRTKMNYTIWSRKGKEKKGRSYVVETSFQVRVL